MWTRLKNVLIVCFALQGCVTVPLTHETEIGVRPETLESLIGSDEKSVVKNLESTPFYRIEDGSSTYFVYEGSYVEGAFWVAITPWPIPLPFPPVETQGRDCLLIEFDEEVFTRFEFGSHEYYELPDCMRAFWTAEEVQSFEHVETTAKSKTQRAELKALKQMCEIPLADAASLNEEDLRERYFRCDHYGVNQESRLLWRCLYAHEGNGNAQYAMGLFYELQGAASPNHYLKAYKWL